MGGGVETSDFSDYEPTSYDPGWRFTFIIVAVCVLINATLPVWLRLGDLWKKQQHNAETDEDHASRMRDEGFAAKSTISYSTTCKNNPYGGGGGGTKSVLSGTSSAIVTDVASAILAARPRRNPGTHLKGPRVKRAPINDGVRKNNVRLAAEHAVIAENANANSNSHHSRTIDGLSNGGSTRDDRSVASLSIMSKLDQDAISVHDAVDAKDAGTTPVTVTVHSTSRGWKKLLEIADYDKEMHKFGTLGFPFALQGFINEFFNIVDVAVIGHFIGVTEANAYVMVHILILFTGTITKGFEECVGVLIPHADGAGNNLLVGRYLQLGIFFHTILALPGAIIWSLLTEEAILWFDFDQETATAGQQYAYTLLVYIFLHGTHECLTEFLNTMDHENYATAFSLIAHACQSILILVLALSGVNDLVIVGLAQVAIGILEIIINLSIMTCNGWLDDYWDGLLRTNGLKDARAVRTVVTTAIPLSVAWLLTYGEWEVMTLFAAHMGPAEVAAWGIIAMVWGAFEAVTDALGDAAEVRVGFRMGSGQTDIAKIVAEKGVYIGFMVATLSCGLLFIIAEYLPGWLTPDPTLQKLIFDMLPLIGFGQILMVPGMIAWAIICAQGRVRLATVIEFFVSWFVALPIAAILTYLFDFNLEGIVGAVVVGYTVGANVYLYVLLKSDWEALSAVVVERNAVEGVGYDEFDWDDLPDEVRDAAMILGYNQDLWEIDGEPECNSKRWVDLTVAEQAAATLLGFDRKKWDHESDTGDDDDSSDDKKTLYDDHDWKELPPNVAMAAKTLGYTEHIWDSGDDGPMDDTDWLELTVEQREAAMILGYDQRVWDGDTESVSTNEDSMPSRQLNYSYNAIKWRDLPPEVISAAKQLGYTKSVWNAKCCTAIRAKDWYELSEKQRDAAAILGYNEFKWSDVKDDKKSIWSYDNDDYSDLPDDVKIAAGVLGYTKVLWDSGGKSRADENDWDELTVKEQDAAYILGYNKDRWNDGDSDNDSEGGDESSKSEKKSAPDESPGDMLYGFLSSVLSSDSKSSSVPAVTPPTEPIVPSQSANAPRITPNEVQTTRSNPGEAFSGSATVRPTYDDYPWRELPRKAQDAATVVGYTQVTWDDNGIPPSAEKEWNQLSSREQRAASTLGYSQSTWDQH